MRLAPKLAVAACWTLALILAAYTLFLTLLYSRPDAALRCLHGRIPDGLPAGAPLESLTPESRLSLFPLGLECSYSYGGVTVVSSPGWNETTIPVVALALVAAGIVIIAANRRRR